MVQIEESALFKFEEGTLVKSDETNHNNTILTKAINDTNIQTDISITDLNDNLETLVGVTASILDQVEIIENNDEVQDIEIDNLKSTDEITQDVLASFNSRIITLESGSTVDAPIISKTVFSYTIQSNGTTLNVVSTYDSTLDTITVVRNGLKLGAGDYSFTYNGTTTTLTFTFTSRCPELGNHGLYIGDEIAVWVEKPMTTIDSGENVPLVKKYEQEFTADGVTNTYVLNWQSNQPTPNLEVTVCGIFKNKGTNRDYTIVVTDTDITVNFRYTPEIYSNIMFTLWNGREIVGGTA